MIARTDGLLSGLGLEWGTAHPSALAEALARRQAQALPVIDLITANPQELGFAFPSESLEEILAEAVRAAAVYRPDARGQRVAREAVAAYHGVDNPDQVILTPGTSLAYYYAFRLLGEPGDEILCPSPTYPLFDDLARLAGRRVRYYHLHQELGNAHWSISPEELAFQITPCTRAIVVVSPHNPTGSIVSQAEMAAFGHIARKHNLAVIVDEVFRECVHGPPSAPARVVECGVPLAITLNGISKMLSLPGLKGGWMVVEGDGDGDGELRDTFLAAAEYVSDLFLPVSEVTQFALPALLGDVGSRARDAIANKYKARMREYALAWQGAGFREVVVPEGSPYLCVPLGSGLCDERIALRLLDLCGVLVHPGQYYRMPGPAMVTTCVTEPPWPIAQIGEALGAR